MRANPEYENNEKTSSDGALRSIWKAGGSGELHCPICGFMYIHHRAVTVRERKGEDKPGLKVVVRPCAEVTTEYIGEKDFPGRRNDMTIAFECEQGCRFELNLKQHKGQTVPTIVQLPSKEYDPATGGWL